MDDKDARGSTTNDAFFHHFQHELAEIKDQIDALSSNSKTKIDNGLAIQECQSRITDLTSEVRDASASLPAHDRRTYGEAIKDLQLKLKDAQAGLAPRQKFSFKSGSSGFAARKNNAAEGAGTGWKTAQSIQPSDQNNGITKPTGTLGTERDSTTISGRNDDYISVPASGGSCNLSTLQRCIVKIGLRNETEGTFANLMLKDIKQSLIVCTHVEGPVHLTNISNSILLLSSRQFRMHDSQSCDVYLSTTSRPIIENCKGIRFAPLPDIYKLGCDEKADDQWRQVDDFNWHRVEPSPNWSILDSTQAVQSAVWQKIDAGASDANVGDRLKQIGLME